MRYDRMYFAGRRSFFYSLGGYRDVPSYFNRLAAWFRPHAGTGPILDVGCAYGFLLARFNDGRDLAGCDVSEWAIAEATRRLPRAQFQVLIPGAGLPYPDAHFSAVLCTDVLEHVAPEHQAFLLAEAARVLAPGGHFCMTTPNLSALRRTVYRGADRREGHIGMRRLEEWSQLLQHQGLRTIHRWTYLHGFLPGRFDDAWMPECAVVAGKDTG
jgi:SAM-dependent methyltransferase